MTIEQFSEWLDVQIQYAEGWIEHGPADKEKHWKSRLETLQEVKNMADEMQP